MANQRRQRLKPFLLKDIEDHNNEQIIGKGAYCTVTKITFRGLVCVAKKIHDIFTENVSEREKHALLDRFVEECELLSRLRHPNIIQFLGVHETERGIPVLVMESMDKSLTRLVEEEGAISHNVAFGVLEDVVLGLVYLHGHSPPIVHRDLTTNNVLVTEGMKAKIADFGVARILNISPSDAAKMTRCPGTQVYMPPEALHEDTSYDVSIDCFSFGVLIIHILSGQWPFPSPPTRTNPVTSVLEAVSEYDRREKYVRSIQKGLPLLELARRCLENEPRMRPLMDDVLMELKTYAQGKHFQTGKVEKIRTLTEELQAAEERFQSAKTHIKKLALSQSQMKEKQEASKINISNLQKQLEEFQDKTHSLERERETAKSELETVREDMEIKHQEDVENLEQIIDELKERKRIQVQQLEQERDSLNQELQGLAEKLQSALSDKETGQSKTSSLQKQMKELQDTRVSLELKLGKLRSEKTELAERNAHLVEVCDPDNISKVKQELEQVLEEKEILEAELKSTQDNLALHQERNLELQEQLEKTSDPQKLAQIQQRMQRYKQERETAKRELETVREEMEIKHREDVENLERMIDELKRKKRKYREHCKAYEQLNGELQLQIKEKDDLIAFLQNVHDYGHQEEEEEEEEDGMKF